jgi:uncharacterized integral membrane protein
MSTLTAPSAVMGPSMTTQSEKNGFSLAQWTVANWLAIVLVILAAAFILQNRDRVTIDVFHVGIQLPLWLSLSVMFVVGWLSGRFWRRSKQAD